jgi:hypothetical protein
LALAIMAATAVGAVAQQPATTPTPLPSQTDQNSLKPEQLEALVAPIALYPDELLANMLAAATKMIGGFALVAYPADYGNSGVMTFIVSHAGAVYQRGSVKILRRASRA